MAAATVGLVKLFGKTIPVPLEVDTRLDPFRETGGGWGEEEKVPISEEGETQSLGSSAGGGGKRKKAPKKPEKILPCPRCESMATKFCYYNNYNLNQPRHFCKNCQRYWTAGGSMRNVPVGAGRRRSKHSAALFRHIAVVKEAPWGFPFSFYPVEGFLSVPQPAVAESEKRLWFPKTLRIDDPAEAAKSSIWASMGFGKEVAGRGGIFGGFEQHKGSHGSAMGEGPRVLHANPAAVSRSFCFQKKATFE